MDKVKIELSRRLVSDGVVITTKIFNTHKTCAKCGLEKRIELFRLHSAGTTFNCNCLVCEKKVRKTYKSYTNRLKNKGKKKTKVEKIKTEKEYQKRYYLEKTKIKRQQAKEA